MGVLARVDDGILRIQADDMDDEVDAAIAPEPRRALQQPNPEIDICCLAQRMDDHFDIVEGRQQWYEDAMTAFFTHHGVHYPILFLHHTSNDMMDPTHLGLSSITTRMMSHRVILFIFILFLLYLVLVFILVLLIFWCVLFFFKLGSLFYFCLF